LLNIAKLDAGRMSIQKPADDFELLLHVAEDPLRLLGGKSFPLFQAFKFGYECGLPAGASFRHLYAPDFEEFVGERFPAPERWPQHLSATCYVHFLGPDDACAFDLYVALLRDYFAAHPPTPPEPTLSERSSLDQMLEAVRQRPRMYFGLTPDLMGCLVALLNGGIEAKRAHTGVSPTAALLENFNAWLNARHPWALGRPWDRILGFQNLWDPERSLTAFWTYFDLFRNSESPDALTPVAKQMFETNPGLDDMTEAQRESWKQQLNRIFYTK
jgi:hypothetical protein